VLTQKEKNITAIGAAVVAIAMASPAIAHDTWVGPLVPGGRIQITRHLLNTTSTSVVMHEEMRDGQGMRFGSAKVQAWCQLGVLVTTSYKTGKRVEWFKDKDGHRWFRFEPDGTRFYGVTDNYISHQFAFACHHWGRSNG